MSVGRIQWESTRRKSPMKKAPIVARTPIDAGIRGPIRSVSRPLTVARPIVSTGAARKISPMTDAEKQHVLDVERHQEAHHADRGGDEQQAQDAKREHPD